MESRFLSCSFFNFEDNYTRKLLSRINEVCVVVNNLTAPARGNSSKAEITLCSNML